MVMVPVVMTTTVMMMMMIPFFLLYLFCFSAFILALRQVDGAFLFSFKTGPLVER